MMVVIGMIGAITFQSRMESLRDWNEGRMDQDCGTAGDAISVVCRRPGHEVYLSGNNPRIDCWGSIREKGLSLSGMKPNFS